MRTLIAVFVSLALTACSSLPSTPKQSYFALKQAYQATLVVAVNYKKWCDKKSKTDKCKGIVTTIQSKDKQVFENFQIADKYLQEGDVTNFDIAVAGLNVSMNVFQSYVKENTNEQ